MEFLVGLFVLAMLLGVYFMPTILAADRKDPNIWAIAAINLFLGWTLIGWVVALAMALRHHKGREAAAPDVSLPSRPREPIASPRAAPAVPETVEGIKQLADLRERGLLTEAEFTAAKARLLESSHP